MLISRDFAKRGQLVGKSESNALCRRRRLGFILTLVVLWSCTILYRLSSLQIQHAGRWQGSADRQHFRSFKISEPRAPIVDREGRLLSVSVPAGSVFVRTRQIKDDDKVEITKKLSKMLDVPESAILKKLSSKSPFVWIARQVPRTTAEQVRTLGLQGVDYLVESRRFYPFGDAASSLIGKVGIDGAGLSGLERVYELVLHGDEVNSNFSRDGVGNAIEAIPAVSMDRLDEREEDGLELTIDAYLQQIVDSELEIGRQNAKAQKAMAVLVDASTGEVLAMGQAPKFDFNTSLSSDVDELKNIIAETVYEPGSTLKPIVAAAALDAGLVRVNELIDCEKGRFVFGKHVIRDVHPLSVVPFKDVIVRSSNIGISKIGARLGAERLYSYLKAFGFGESTGLGLPGETQGILRNVSGWAKVDVATHSFGQGLAVTPLQMVRAVSAIANDGVIPDLHVVAHAVTEGTPPNRILSQKTARATRDLMYAVVEDEHGTGKKAAITGFRVGGKTGTAQKALKDGRGYAPNKYVASFVGFVDGAEVGIDKTLSLIVIIDEPNTDSIYGGTLAAPVFQKILSRSLQYLGMTRELRRGIVPGYTVASHKKGKDGVGTFLANAGDDYDSGRS